MAVLDRKELEEMATEMTEVKNPDVYSRDKKHINKPIANIKFGHLLNINWDNILNTFKILQKFFRETVLKQDVSSDNLENKIVLRNADKSIQVGDIYSSSKINDKGAIPDGAGIPYKDPKSNEIVFTKDYTAFRKITNTVSRDDMAVIKRLDKGNASFKTRGGSRVIDLIDEAKKYKIIIIRMSADNGIYGFYLLLPNIVGGLSDLNRHGGGFINATWDGATKITVNFSGWRDGGTGGVDGVWGLM